MADAQVIDATADEVGTDLVPAPPSAALFKTDDPVEVIEKATRAADALKSVVASRGLIVSIRGKEHPRVEAWQTLGAMLGVFPVPAKDVQRVPWPSPVPDELKELHRRGLAYGFEAFYRAQRPDGSLLGGGEAMCTRSEGRPWKDGDDYALKSMAQTRAISKALSSPLRFVMTLAGYEGTPAEEMPGDARPAATRSTAARVSAAPAQRTERAATAKQRGLINVRASEKGLPPTSLADIIRAAAGQTPGEFDSQDAAKAWVDRNLERLPGRLVDAVLDGIANAAPEAS